MSRRKEDIAEFRALRSRVFVRCTVVVRRRYLHAHVVVLVAEVRWIDGAEVHHSVHVHFPVLLLFMHGSTEGQRHGLLDVTKKHAVIQHVTFMRHLEHIRGSSSAQGRERWGLIGDYWVAMVQAVQRRWCLNVDVAVFWHWRHELMVATVRRAQMRRSYVLLSRSRREERWSAKV